MGEVPARIAEINSGAQLNVDGGMLAWAGAGRPVVTDDGGAGTI